MRKRRVKRNHLLLVRRFALEAFLEDRDTAISVAQARVQAHYESIVATLVLAVLLKIVAYYITKWITDNLTNPPKEPQDGELNDFNDSGFNAYDPV